MQEPISEAGGMLYLGRDIWLMAFYKSLNKKGALSKSHIHDMGKTNAVYTRKSA